MDKPLCLLLTSAWGREAPTSEQHTKFFADRGWKYCPQSEIDLENQLPATRMSPATPEWIWIEGVRVEPQAPHRAPHRCRCNRRRHDRSDNGRRWRDYHDGHATRA